MLRRRAPWSPICLLALVAATARIDAAVYNDIYAEEPPVAPNLGVDNYNFREQIFVYPAGYPPCLNPFSIFHFVLAHDLDAWGNPIPDDPSRYVNYIGIYYPSYRSFGSWYTFEKHAFNVGGPSTWSWGPATHDASQHPEFARYAPAGPMSSRIASLLLSGKNPCDPDFPNQIESDPLPGAPADRPADGCPAR